jgi:hypothetical protein
MGDQAPLDSVERALASLVALPNDKQLLTRSARSWSYAGEASVKGPTVQSGPYQNSHTREGTIAITASTRTGSKIPITRLLSSFIQSVVDFRISSFLHSVLVRTSQSSKKDWLVLLHPNDPDGRARGSHDR